MTWQKYAGAASGGVLGYIHGNLPGAYVGAKAGYNLSQMKRAYATPPRTPSKRKLAVPRSKSSMQKLMYSKLPVAHRTRHSGRHARRRYRKSGNGNKALLGISQHNDLASMPAKNIIIRSPHKALKTLGKFVLYHSYDSILDPLQQGIQTAGYGNELLNRNQLIGNTAAGVSNYALQWATDPYKLNPYSTAQGNPIYTIPGTTPASADLLRIESVSSEFQFVNLSTVPSVVKVYFFMCKKGNSIPPITHWNNVLKGILADGGSGGEGYFQTNATSAAGPTTTTGVTAQPTIGWADYTRLGTEPTKARGFSTLWKELDKTVFTLQPGDRINMKRNFSVHKTVLRQNLTDLNTAYLAGLSIVPLVITYAGIVGIEPDAGGKVSHVAFGQPKIGFVQTDWVHFAALPVNRYKISRYEPGLLERSTNNEHEVNDVDVSMTPSTI